MYYRDKIFVMGGEGANRMFGQNEAYDPQTNKWEHYAPTLTPRPRNGGGRRCHIVAGGGPVVGDSVQSAVHEAFTLS